MLLADMQRSYPNLFVINKSASAAIAGRENRGKKRQVCCEPAFFLI